MLLIPQNILTREDDTCPQRPEAFHYNMFQILHKVYFLCNLTRKSMQILTW